MHPHGTVSLAGDELPSMSAAARRVLPPHEAPAHARCLPPCERGTCLREAVRERTRRVTRRTRRTTLVVVCMPNNIRCALPNVNKGEQKPEKQSRSPIVLFPYG